MPTTHERTRARRASSSTLPNQSEGSECVGRRSPESFLLGLGTAVPDLNWSQAEIGERLARLWGLDAAALDRWRRIIQGSGVERRHGVLPPDLALRLTTAQRMLAYEQHAPALAEAAARNALRSAGIAPADVSDVVVVSCTGMSAPGVDVQLVQRLQMPLTTRRTSVGFMGCFGAINGLRVASGLCAANPNATVLLVCVELCSLHMRHECDGQNQVASALFSDGAAAAVLSSGDVPRARGAGFATQPLAVARIGRGSSRLVPATTECMTWRITDRGFAMTLGREVPGMLRQHVRAFVREAGASRDDVLIVHPGGPGVLHAVEQGLAGERGVTALQISHEVLRRFGNMSSATILFVLEQAMSRALQPPFLLIAFGPGLTMEALQLLPAERA